MGIKEIYSKIQESGHEISRQKFEELIEEKVGELGGLCDRDTAAKLVAKDIGVESGEGPIKIEEITADKEKTSLKAEVIEIQGVRTFERDDSSIGRVANIQVGDETGEITLVLWDEMADHVKTNEIEIGDTLRIRNARVKEGYNGLELNVGGGTRIEKIDSSEVSYQRETTDISSITEDMGSVHTAGEILKTGEIKKFEKKDGETGKVRTIKIGDETGKIDVSLWEEHAEKQYSEGDRVEINHGYTRQRYGETRLNVGYRGNIKKTDREINYQADTTQLKNIQPDRQYDVLGNITGIEETKTFQRKDGSEGKVANIYIDDGTDEVRAALWGDHTKKTEELDIGDIIRIEDAKAKEGYNNQLELSVGWNSTIHKIESETKEVRGDIKEVRGGTEIDIKGTVITPSIIDDGTGCIKITDRELPEIGTNVRVKGTAMRTGPTTTVEPEKIEETHQDPEDIEIILEEASSLTNKNQDKKT